MAPSLNYIDQIVMILSSVQSFVVDGILHPANTSTSAHNVEIMAFVTLTKPYVF